MGAVAKRKPKLYEPKFDFGHPSYPLPKKIADKLAKKFDGEWVSAPGSSHLKSFRLVDGRELPRTQAPAFHTKSRGKDVTAGIPFENPPDKPQPSWIDVKFRATASTPETWYAYRFDDFAEAEHAFELLTEAEHPGEVIHSYFIGNGVPYKKVA